MKKTRISFYTLGCRLNQAETAVLQNSFKTCGYQVVDFGEAAEVVVINTCTVTEHGDADTRHILNKIVRLNPKSQIALIGCQAQMQKEKLAQMPNVKWVIGNAVKMDLVSLFKKTAEASGVHVDVPPIPRETFTMPAAGIDRRHTRANIKIQDGCDFFCSFCEIPYARGRARSREFNDIIKEAHALVAAGHKELVITGINLGSYHQNNRNIIDVIHALEEINGLERIRISSVEPTTIPAELLKTMSKGKLCRHLHIPLQSGSNAILKLMSRKHTAEDFFDFIQKTYDEIPGICIGTDVMVGFPGETEAYFNETRERLLASPIHYFHVFSFSPRTMAKAKKLADPVPAKAIQERSQILRDLSYRKRRIFHETLLKSTQKVLFEQKKGDHWSGLTDNYVRVKVKSDKTLANQMIDVRLTQIEKNYVLGDLAPVSTA